MQVQRWRRARHKRSHHRREQNHAALKDPHARVIDPSPAFGGPVVILAIGVEYPLNVTVQCPHDAVALGVNRSRLEALALSGGPQRSTRAESPVSPEISPKEICQTVFG